MEIGRSNLITISGHQHHDTLLDSLWRFVHNQEKVDFFMARSGQLLWAHQLILRVFFPPERLQEIGMQHWHDSSLDWLLEFVYRGTVSVPEEQLDSLLDLASQLNFTMLVDALLTAKSSSGLVASPSSLNRLANIITDETSPKYDLAISLDDQTSTMSAALGKSKLIAANDGDPYDQTQTGLPKNEDHLQMTFKQEPHCWEQSTECDNEELRCEEWAEPTIKLEIIHSPETVCNDNVDDDGEGELGLKESVQEDGQEDSVNQCEVYSYAEMESELSQVSMKDNVVTSESAETNSERAKKLSMGLPNVRMKKYPTSETDKLKCQVCSKTFTKPSNLLIHTQTHTGEKPYKCKVCSKAFGQSGSLVVHMRIHTGEKPYKCLVCSKAFVQNSRLVQHSRIHTGEKPYKCQVCARAFNISSHLVCHMRTHTGERPYKCKVCSKAFNTSSHLVCHMRIHTGEKQYQCKVCSRAFMQAGHLVVHMRNKHR